MEDCARRDGVLRDALWQALTEMGALPVSEAFEEDAGALSIAVKEAARSQRNAAEFFEHLYAKLPENERFMPEDPQAFDVVNEDVVFADK